MSGRPLTTIANTAQLSMAKPSPLSVYAPGGLPMQRTLSREV